LVADFLERNLVWSTPEVANPNVIV